MIHFYADYGLIMANVMRKIRECGKLNDIENVIYKIT
jgi:hypothetical protein